MPSRAVVWFRRDLRTADHPALLAALAAADQSEAGFCSREGDPATVIPALAQKAAADAVYCSHEYTLCPPPRHGGEASTRRS